MDERSTALVEIKKFIIKYGNDKYLQRLWISLFVLALFSGILLSFLISFIVIFSYATGCLITILVINYKQKLLYFADRGKYFFGIKELNTILGDCKVCGNVTCGRHFNKPTSAPWKNLLIDKQLDAAISKLFTEILNSFVRSWFCTLSNEEYFVQLLKNVLREATSRLALKVQDVNLSQLLANRLLPCVFSHVEVTQKMLKENVQIDRLATTFLQKDQPIHPAVANRTSEINYLRAIAKFLIPRIINNENLESTIIFSLLRELIACWVLLPIMDAISDPNLINLLIILCTNKSKSVNYKQAENVVFLEDFASKFVDNSVYSDISFLSDQNKLYAFMQFLKKENAVDLLRFHLDVDHLNQELMDPKVTTDASKLSSLQQQAESLFSVYQEIMQNEAQSCKTLAEAHLHVQSMLCGQWLQAFYKTPEFFRLTYGNREISQDECEKNTDAHFSGPVSRLGLKIKGAIRGAIDGTPLEATEVPTVWDGFTDPINNPNTINPISNMTQKLRKERGQNLDGFLKTFMTSVEQSTDVGEEVIEGGSSLEFAKKTILMPGRNRVFGDLFDLKSDSIYVGTFATMPMHWIRGPSYCFIYILSKLIKAPIVVVRFVTSLISISIQMCDEVICRLFCRAFKSGMYQPRLAAFVTALDDRLFCGKFQEVLPHELVERQRQAKKRLDAIYMGLGSLADVVQSPALNKHLMYCLFDLFISELYSELDNISKE